MTVSPTANQALDLAEQLVDAAQRRLRRRRLRHTEHVLAYSRGRDSP